MYPRLRVCVGDAQWFRLVAVFRRWGVPKTSFPSPDDNVHLNIPIGRKRLRRTHASWAFASAALQKGNLAAMFSAIPKNRLPKP